MCRAPSGISSGGMIETSSQPSPVLRSRVGVAHDRLQASGERPATAVGPGMVWVKQVDRVTSRPARPSGISVATMSQASAHRRIVVTAAWKAQRKYRTVFPIFNRVFIFNLIIIQLCMGLQKLHGFGTGFCPPELVWLLHNPLTPELNTFI